MGVEPIRRDRLGGFILGVEAVGDTTGLTIVYVGSKAITNSWTFWEDVGITHPVGLLMERRATEAAKVGLGRAQGPDRDYRLIDEGLEGTSNMLDEGFRCVPA